MQPGHPGLIRSPTGLWRLHTRSCPKLWLRQGLEQFWCWLPPKDKLSTLNSHWLQPWLKVHVDLFRSRLLVPSSNRVPTYAPGHLLPVTFSSVKGLTGCCSCNMDDPQEVTGKHPDAFWGWKLNSSPSEPFRSNSVDTAEAYPLEYHLNILVATLPLPTREFTVNRNLNWQEENKWSLERGDF